MTLLEQRSSYSIELMRVASGAAERSEIEQAGEVPEPKAASEDQPADARARKRPPTAAA